MEYEVCVIGAGIIGSALAYELVASGFTDVLLLDQVSY